MDKIKNYSRAAMAGAVVLLAACTPNKDERALQQVVQQVASPSYMALSDKTVTLARMAAGYCGIEPQKHLQHPLLGKLPEVGVAELRNAWRESWSAWQQAQVIGFGPIKENNRQWRLQFWPDKKNLIKRKVESLIRSEDSLTPDRLEVAGVLLQGLSAQEYLLFDKASAFGGDDHVRRCDLLALSAAASAATAQELTERWRSFGPQFSAPGEANTRYPTKLVALKDVLDSLATLVERLKRNKLAAPLGLQPEGGLSRVRPYLAEAWRSDASLLAMQKNLQGMQRLYAAIGAYVSSVDESLHARIVAAFSLSHQQLFALKPPFSQRLQEDSQALVALHHSLADLQDLLSTELPSALNITLGFNANDGD